VKGNCRLGDTFFLSIHSFPFHLHCSSLLSHFFPLTPLSSLHCSKLSFVSFLFAPSFRFVGFIVFICTFYISSSRFWFICFFAVLMFLVILLCDFFNVFHSFASRFLYTFVVLQISLYYDLITNFILCLVCFSKQKVCDVAFAHVILLYCTTNKFSYFSQLSIDLHVFLVQFYTK